MVTKGMQKQGANGFEKLVGLYLKKRYTNEVNNPKEKHLDEDSLATFVEGNLNQKESISIVKHLIDCTSCRRTTAEIVRLNETFEEISTKGSVVSSSTSNGFLEFWKTLTDKIISPIDQAAVAYQADPNDDLESNTNKKTKSTEKQS